MNLSARSNPNGPIRVEDETTLRSAVVADLGSFFTSLSTAADQVFGVKFIARSGTVGLLRFETFPFEEKAICGVWSGQRWME